MSLFLGVDGGGTKTDFVLVGHDGTLAASHQGGATDHLQIGLEGVHDALAAGLAALFGRAAIKGDDITHAFFGLPCYGEDSVAQARLDAMPEPLLGHRRYRCGNDMICAWAGSLGGEDGINIVAGTGSIGYGERRGKAARAGGWSEVFGDEGSAYWIAVRGLNIFSRMSDGRLARGPLYGIYREALALENDLDLCGEVMNSRGAIAAMSQLVTRAAQAGDELALHVFDEAARELASIVRAVREALEFQPAERIPLSYSGGVFNAGAPILDPFRGHLTAQSDAYDLREPMVTPGMGAAIYAARLAAQPLSAAAIQRLQRFKV